MPEAAEFPKLFWDLTPKVSNSMQRGAIWSNYSLQRILTHLNLAFLKTLFCKKRYMTLGCLRQALMFRAKFKNIKSNMTVSQKNGYSPLQTMKLFNAIVTTEKKQ